MNREINDSLCWRCSKAQGFYQNPCQNCGAINPNTDFDGALLQLTDNQDTIEKFKQYRKGTYPEIIHDQTKDPERWS